MPNGHRAFAASLDRLSDVINQFAFLWNKDRAELNALQTVQPRADDPLEDAALHGLAVFARMTSEAIDRRLPMLIDC